MRDPMGEKKYKIDDIDRYILKEYLLDARLSNREAAKVVNVSPGTSLSRTKKMEETGIISGYSAILDYEMLGYDLTVITEVTISKGKLLEVGNEIAKLDGVCAVYDVTGDSDVIIIAKFRNRKELSSFTKKILSMHFVERTNTKVALTTIKEDFRINP